MNISDALAYEEQKSNTTHQASHFGSQVYPEINYLGSFLVNHLNEQFYLEEKAGLLKLAKDFNKNIIDYTNIYQIQSSASKVRDTAAKILSNLMEKELLYRSDLEILLDRSLPCRPYYTDSPKSVSNTSSKIQA